MRFRRSIDRAKFVQLITGSGSVTFCDLVHSKAADIHLQPQRHRSYCSLTLLSVQIVSRIKGKTSLCQPQVAQGPLGSPIVFSLKDEFIEQDPEPMAVEVIKPDECPTETDDILSGSLDACPEASLVSVHAVVVDACSLKEVDQYRFHWTHVRRVILKQFMHLRML